MKCPEALATIVDAEPADLSPESSSALADHLRSCARCARVAATVRDDMRALAAVMPATPTATRRPWMLWPGVAMAGAVAVLVFVMTRGTTEPTVRIKPPSPAPLVVARPTAPLPPAAQTPTVRAPIADRRVAAARYAMPDPPSLGALSDLQERTSPVPASQVAVVGVSASSNGGVIVLKTSNPKITVIWFN